MARWNDLISALGIDGQIVNPYWNKTKGEMIAACSNRDFLESVLPLSMSCSSPTKGRWQGKGVEQCGYCLPCLIRRASIESALGKGNDPTPYTLDLKSGNILSTSSAEGKQVRSFQLAIKRLRSRPGLAKLLVHKSGSLSDETRHLDELAGVYARGMEEVAGILSGVKTRSN